MITRRRASGSRRDHLVDADIPPAADGVLAEKLRDSPRDGLGTLDVQQVTDAIDRALVDLRQR